MRRNRHYIASVIYLMISFIAISLIDSNGLYGIMALIVALISFGLFILNANRHAARRLK